MSAHRAGHDTRCERSATDAKRCRCDCKGRLHGIEHKPRVGQSHDDITDDLEALEQLEVAR